MELWVTEYQTPSLGFSLRVSETLRNENTDYQHLAVVVTEQFGKMLLLDGMVMTTDVDEYVYHEMITQIALNSHPNPAQVCIIGGGDGGALREVVEHPQVTKGTLVEIDNRVIQASRDFFPQLSCSFDNPKAEVIVNDGIQFIKEQQARFDIVIVDSTEPVGPAVELFSESFYSSVHRALKDDGMLVVQSESPFFNQEIIQMAYRGISKSFPITKVYTASVPTYPSGLWSFTVGSKKYDPEQIQYQMERPCRYYTPEIHKAAFKLPYFLSQLLKAGK